MSVRTLISRGLHFAHLGAAPEARIKGKKAEEPDKEDPKADDDEDDVDMSADNDHEDESDETDDDSDIDKTKSKKGKRAKAKAESDDSDDSSEKDDDEGEDEPSKNGKRADFRRGVVAERKRCAAIFGHPAAGRNPVLAANLAFRTGMSAAVAIATLKDTPAAATHTSRFAEREAHNPRIDPGVSEHSKEASVAASWDAALTKAGLIKK